MVKKKKKRKILKRLCAARHLFKDDLGNYWFSFVQIYSKLYSLWNTCRSSFPTNLNQHLVQCILMTCKKLHTAQHYTVPVFLDCWYFQSFSRHGCMMKAAEASCSSLTQWLWSFVFLSLNPSIINLLFFVEKPLHSCFHHVWSAVTVRTYSMPRQAKKAKTT